MKMSEDTTQNNNTVMDNKWLLPLILSIMTLLTSGLLMFGNEVTKDKIAAIKLANKLASLQRLLPNELYDNDVLADAQAIFEPIKLGHRREEQLYLGKMNNVTSVMAIPVTAQNGYSGDIELMIGVKVGGAYDGEITAIEIIAHKETPGLGDLIESNKSDWLTQFPNKSLKTPSERLWKVKKDQGDFDQITAATITPRAVVAAIKKALVYHRELASEQGNQNE